MKRKLSKDQLADFAHQAVSSLRRLMSSNHDSMTLTQQDLLSTSKAVEERWQKKRMAVDGSLVDLWATSFQEELLFQLEHNALEKGTIENSTSRKSNTDSAEDGQKTSPPKLLGESAMLTCMEALRILLRTTGAKLTEKLLSCHIAKHMTNYFMRVPMSKKVRDAFAVVFLEVIAFNEQLLDECLIVSESHLAPSTGKDTELSVTPLQVHLAWTIAAACRRADVNSLSLNTVRARCGRCGFLSSLIHTSAALTGCIEGSAVGSLEGAPLTSCLAYVGLISSLVRDCESNKRLCLKGHREELSSLWVVAASNVWRVELTMPIPTNTPGKDVPLAVEPAQAWAAELTDLLIELCTTDSFALRRQSLYEDSMDNSHNRSAPLHASPPASPSPLSSPGMGQSARRYEPLPVHWDTLLTGGSAHVWRLASLLFHCTLVEDACGIIATVLLRVDTQNSLSECIYRNIIATLLLLCVATPRNAELLAESPIMEALIALITHLQESAFPREVTIYGKSCVPTHTLNANTVQLTMGFMSLLNSLYFSEEELTMLQRAVEEMCTRVTAQTDADIVESLLHVQSCTSFPPGVLFFSGSGSVVCKVDRFSVTRFHGYSFAAWINPKCVWLEGNHLYSHADASSGSSVVLMIVANGRSCSLALRIQHSTEVTLSLIPDTSLPADAWSHVAFAHSLSGFIVFINGRRTEVSLNVPFPKDPSKKNRLQFAFGGCPNEPSFFGFIASIELLDGTLTDKDVQRMYQVGPRPSRELSLPCHPLLSVESQKYVGSNLLSVGVSGSLMGKHEGVSVQSVVVFNPPNTLETFQRHDVVNWALNTIEKAQVSLSFSIVARLCVQFFCTAMKLTTTEEELCSMTNEGALARLRHEILNWDSMSVELPALLIACTIPRGRGKIMRAHITTQHILSLLLDVVEAGNVNPTTISCILRELSDALLVPENVARFREGPRRYEQILRFSVKLPPECVENLVILAERLCKEPPEMEQTLLFLLGKFTTKTADHVKAEILRMLFEVARTNTSMCDLIGVAFGNSGLSFLIKLVGGMNHSSEVIRIYALRTISLMQHTNRKFRESFVKSRGYEILASVMTEPSCTVPVRLPTFNCLFQVAFDALQPTSRDPSIAYLAAGSPSKTKRRSVRPQYQDPNKGSIGQTLGLQGHMPGLLSQQLRVTRREYSFDTSYDFAHSGDVRFLLDDMSRTKGGGGSGALQVPQAFQTILLLLERQLQNIYSSNSTNVFINYTNGNGTLCTASPFNMSREATMLELAAASADQLDERSPMNTMDNISTASVLSPTIEDSTETVALRVLSHLEKIVDRPGNAEVLLPHPWLMWLWTAVGQVIDPAGCSNGAMGPASQPCSRQAKKFNSAIQQRTRNILRSLAILDLSRNTKATTVRIVRGGECPPALTRLVLEAIVSHLTKRSAISSQEDAVNIIKNLDYLFTGIESIVHLPVVLGVDIVNAISSIAVNNNSWVRMRMKNSSHLFETRSHLAFLLLATTKHFSKLDPSILGQLLDANAHETNTIRALLRRLVSAASRCDADEVEVLLAAVRQLISTDQNNRQMVHTILGPEYHTFADLICNFPSLPPDGAPNSSVAAHSPMRGEERTEATLPTSEVIKWCRADEARWEIIRQRVSAAAKVFDVGAYADGAAAEREWLAKNHRAEERRQAALGKVKAEVERITREVEAHVNRNNSNNNTNSSISNNGEFTLATQASFSEQTSPPDLTRTVPST